MKIIKLDCTPNPNQGETTLKASIAMILAKAISMSDNKLHKPEEFMETADLLIEVLGEDTVKNIALSKEIEETVLEFKARPAECLMPTEKVIVNAIKEETPWYDRFYKKGKNGSFQEKQNYINKKIQKRTRKK